MNAYITEARRTAIGKANAETGIFRNTRADELLAQLIRSLIGNCVPTDAIDDVYIGCVGQHLEQGKNIARLASLLAGLPEKVPGVTINRLCASSLQAFNFAATAVHAGQADVILAGGVEHMHHVPMAAALDYNKALLDRYEFPFTNMGLTAEKVAEKFGITRQHQDEFSVLSHKKAAKAQSDGHFSREIVSVKTPEGMAANDQGIRPNTTSEALAGLKTIFKENGTVTAGNSSPLSDGASLSVVASEKACARYGLKKRAEIVDFAVVGLDPTTMGLGPVPAMQKLLERTALKIQDIDLFELNEAFASQVIACIRNLEIPTDKVNPSGGAIALGHPLGCTGTRLITTLLHGLERTGGELGIASMCIGHGQGIATLIKRIGS